MEAVIRAATLYFILMIIFRLTGKRTMSQATTFDMVVLLVISEAVQNFLVDQDHSFTHMLLDISLPQISGLEVCRQARQRCAGQALRIIAYTAHAMPHEIQELQDAGFDSVLVKPIRRQDLIEALGLGPSPTDPA